jgi:hypothetical protein
MALLKSFVLRLNVKEGKIKSGTKKVNAAGKEYPASLDYFNIDDFPELKAGYGEKPAKLVIYLPANNIEDFYSERFALYNSSNQAVRYCDGDVCTHRMSEELCGDTYGAGEQGECVCKMYEDQEDFDKKKKCRFVAHIKAFVGVPPSMKPVSADCYLFETGSINSGINIKSELFKLQHLTGGNIAGLPFRIEVRMVGGKDDAKKKFPIWELRSLVALPDLEKRMLAMGVKTFADTLMLPAASEEPAVEAPPPVNEVSVEEMMDSEFTEIERTLDSAKLTEWTAKYIDTLNKFSTEKRGAWRKRYKELGEQIDRATKQGEMFGEKPQ